VPPPRRRAIELSFARTARFRCLAQEDERLPAILAGVTLSPSLASSRKGRPAKRRPL